jgi:hypothetical protein
MGIEPHRRWEIVEGPVNYLVALHGYRCVTVSGTQSGALANRKTNSGSEYESSA